MAETVALKYSEALSQALQAWKDWLERSEIGRLKEELRVFQISYSVLYNVFLKKKLIHEDPYKQESKITDIEIPETGPFIEAKKLEQLSLRLASYDSQLDFLVNFYQFGVDFLNLERIRRILGLVRYIDWANLTPDSQSPNTSAVADITIHSKAGGDPLTLSIIGESLTKLPKCTATIIGILRNLNTYHKETYKLNVRNAITGMQAGEINAVNIRKKISQVMPGTPFYQEFIEELIKEDYSKDSQSLREAVLKSLVVKEEKPKAVKKIDYKIILLDGIQAIGSAASVMTDCARKIDENETVLANKKKGFCEKLRLLIRAMMRSEPDELIFELQYTDQVTGAKKTEDLNFNHFRADMDKKTRILAGMSSQGPVMSKLKGMPEEQVTGYLERTIRDIQSYHRILSSLDEYFKANVAPADRDKIKGIKPELASVKNCIIRANQLRHEYNAQKEEEEQMKRLGINPNS